MTIAVFVEGGMGIGLVRLELLMTVGERYTVVELRITQNVPAADDGAGVGSVIVENNALVM